MKKFPLLAVFFAITLKVFGADFYVASVPQGAGDGSSAANAIAVNSLNLGSLVPGDTLHLVGILTNSIRLTTSGTAANPITVHFEPGAKLSLPNGELIVMNNLSYVVIDGGLNGVIQNTATGTGLTYSNAATFIDASGSSSCTFKNLLFQNQYIHTSTNDAYPDIAASGAIYANGLGGSNYIISDTFSNIGWCVSILATPSFLLVTNCAFFNYDHGVVPGGTNIVIVGNHFDTAANWDTVANAYHHDPIHFFGANPTNVASFIIAGNIFTNNLGNNNTAMIYLETAPPNVLLYNNLFLQYPSNYLNDGMVVAMGKNTQVLNNTFAGTVGTYNSSGLVTGTAGTVVANNLFNSLDNYVYVQTGAGLVFSNNIYANHAAGGNSPWATKGGSFGTFSAWQAAVGDANSFYTNAVVVNANGTLPLSSPAVGAGANLSGLFTTDFSGTGRLSIGAWVVGAVSGIIGSQPTVSGAPVISVTPIGQIIGVISVGAMTNEVFMVSNTGGGTLSGNASVGAPYNIVSGGSYNLSAGQSQTVIVSYHPTTVGASIQLLTFGGGAGTNITLNGTAVMPPPQNLQPHVP